MGAGAGKEQDGNKKQKLTKKDLKFFLKEIKEHTAGINSMTLTPDGSMLISAHPCINAPLTDHLIGRCGEHKIIITHHRVYIFFVSF